MYFFCQQLSFDTLFMKMGCVVPIVELETILFVTIKILSNFPLSAVITLLAQKCCDVNMGFQKWETISFELMHVDKQPFSE